MDVSLTKGHHRHEGDSGVKSNRNITIDRPADRPTCTRAIEVAATNPVAGR